MKCIPKVFHFCPTFGVHFKIIVGAFFDDIFATQMRYVILRIPRYILHYVCMRDDINPRPLFRFAHRAKYIRMRSSVLPGGQNIAPEGYIAPRKRYIANPGRDLYRCGVFPYKIHR